MTTRRKPTPAASDRTTLPASASVRVDVLLGQFGVWHLTCVHQMFDGDLLLARILGEIAHHNIGTLDLARATQAEAPRGHVEQLFAEGRLLPSNAYSIATACGLPRETVRRKVAALIARGWIERRANGDLYLTALPTEQFFTFNREFTRRVLELADRIREVTTPADPP